MKYKCGSHLIPFAPFSFQFFCFEIRFIRVIRGCSAFQLLYLGCSRSARPLPRGCTGHVAHPVRSIQFSALSSQLLNTSTSQPLPASTSTLKFELYLEDE